MSLSQAAAAALLNLEEEQNLYADIDENETEAVFNILKQGEKSDKVTTSNFLDLDSVFIEEDCSASSALKQSIRETKPFSLPKHFRCASHTMNLVAKNDANKIVALVDDPMFKVLFRRVFSKVKEFWNKIGRSVVIADEVSEILGKYYL